ncbi:MAG TPA: NF038122 family metalloprotease, partial [Pyrinomonadaceae bacterium]
MSSIPRFGHNPFARIYNPILANQFRSFLALGLAALIFLSPLSATALAQTQSIKVVAPRTGDAAPGKAFIVYETKDGVGCRSASPDEKQEIFNAGKGQTLRQINHLKSSDGDFLTEGTVNGNGQGLKIILLSTPQLDANTAAKNAFIAAAAHWEAIIQTPMTVYMKVDYGSTRFGKAWPPGVLASTGTPSVFAGYSAVRNNMLLEAGNSGSSKIALYNLLPASAVPTDLGDDFVMGVNISVARAIGLIPADAAAANENEMPTIAFNSTKQYDFEPNPASAPGCNNNGIECNKTDFDAVATHEIGHALGFTSNNGEGGEPPNMDVWDLFRFRPGVTNFNSNQRVMSAGGLQVFFDGGATELGVSTGGPDGEGTGGDGEQSSHWKDDNEFPSAYIGIMDPTISQGRRQVITDNDKRALNAFGYNLDNNTPPPPAPPPPTPPVNNNFGSAQVVSGCSGSIFGTNLGATKESGEPNHSPDDGGGQRSVWYRWTAPSTGSVTFTTKGSSYDTVLGVYSGASVGSLTPFGKNDDVTPGSDTSSSVTFDAVASTTYMIAVDGYNNGSGGDMGNVKLNWSQANCTVTATNDIKLSQDNYSFTEGTVNTAQGFGLLSVDVTRGDPNAGPATVQYFTQDGAGGNDCNIVNGSASQRCDYATAAGTLRFAQGEATKTIQIP